MKKPRNVDCCVAFEVTFSFSSLLDMTSVGVDGSRESDDAWGVMRGDEGGEDSKIMLEEGVDARGRALP